MRLTSELTPCQAWDTLRTGLSEAISTANLVAVARQYYPTHMNDPTCPQELEPLGHDAHNFFNNEHWMTLIRMHDQSADFSALLCLSISGLEYPSMISDVDLMVLDIGLWSEKQALNRSTPLFHTVHFEPEAPWQSRVVLTPCHQNLMLALIHISSPQSLMLVLSHQSTRQRSLNLRHMFKRSLHLIYLPRTCKSLYRAFDNSVASARFVANLMRALSGTHRDKSYGC